MLSASRPLPKVRLIVLLLLLLSVACTQGPQATATSNSIETPLSLLEITRPPSSPTAVEPSPTASPTPVEAAVQSPTSEAVQVTTPLSSPAVTCTNLAEFVRNLSISDFTSIKPEMSFTKVWQIKNIGTCTWTTGYSLVFMSGEAMQGQAPIALPHEVRPGETVDLRITLVSPKTPRTYTGNWMLQDEAGNLFGIGEAGNQPLVVQIIVPDIVKLTPT